MKHLHLADLFRFPMHVLQLDWQFVWIGIMYYVQTLIYLVIVVIHVIILGHVAEFTYISQCFPFD